MSVSTPLPPLNMFSVIYTWVCKTVPQTYSQLINTQSTQPNLFQATLHTCLFSTTSCTHVLFIYTPVCNVMNQLAYLWLI